MAIVEAFILGVIQGLTEFFPVSSSGHLVLVRKLFGFKDLGVTFDAILHLGTLIALVIFFAKDWMNLFTGLVNKAKREERKLLLWIVIGTIPVVIVGFFALDYLDNFFRDIIWVAAFLIITGFIFLIADKYDQFNLKRKDLKETKLLDTILVGIAQAIALLPGVSRSGITISAGIFSKIKRVDAARFSFLLATPAIFGASMLSLYKMYESGTLFAAPTELAVGFITSLVVGLFAIKYFLLYLKKYNLFPFAIYVIVLGVFLLIGEFYLF